MDLERDMDGGALRRPTRIDRDHGGNLGGPRAGDQVESDIPDGGTVKKIAKDVMQAVDKQYGHLVTRLRCRIHDYEKRMDYARASSEQYVVEKSTLQERIEDLQFQASDLRDQMATAMASGNGGQSMGMFVGVKQAKTMKQKFAKMPSGIGFDVDIEGMEHNTGILSHARMQSMWTTPPLTMHFLL
jgi:hypothetical protein